MTDDLSRFGISTGVLWAFHITVVLMLMVSKSYAQKIETDDLAKKVKKIAEYVQDPSRHKKHVRVYDTDYKPPAEKDNPKYNGIYAEIEKGVLYRITLDNKTYQDSLNQRNPVYAKSGFTSIQISAGDGGKGILFEDFNLDGKLDNVIKGHSVDTQKSTIDDHFRYHLDKLLEFYGYYDIIKRWDKDD